MLSFHGLHSRIPNLRKFLFIFREISCSASKNLLIKNWSFRSVIIQDMVLKQVQKLFLSVAKLWWKSRQNADFFFEKWRNVVKSCNIEIAWSSFRWKWLVYIPSRWIFHFWAGNTSLWTLWEICFCVQSAKCKLTSASIGF